MNSENRTTLVYRFKAYAPDSTEQHALAVQALGQAWLYREDLRRAYNEEKRFFREQSASSSEAEHVRAYEAHVARTDDAAHVFAAERALSYATRKSSVNERIRQARARRGHLLDAGTYWRVEEAVLQASKASGPKPIRSVPFDGTGTLGAAIQSTDKFPAERFVHKRVALDVVRVRPNGKKDAMLTIAIGELKAERRVAWPVFLHRDFPAGATVDRVAVQRVRTGHYFGWELLVTLTFGDDGAQRERDRNAQGVVGVDVGWRDDGPRMLRVATHDGCTENHEAERGVLHIDAVDRFAYADDVRSIRDRLFDEAKAYAQNAGLPGAEHAKIWRDKARLLRVAEKTKELGTSWWRLRDRHLQEIESGVRARAVRRRLDAMRVYADRLARCYRIVALEDMAMLPWTGTLDAANLERHRSAAAISILQRVLVDRFGPDRIDWVPAEYSTRTCADCGVVRGAEVGPKVEWVCEGCGVTHHQDENAARILRLRSERWIDDGNAPRARGKRSPQKKRKKTGDEAPRKIATRPNEEGARKTEDEAAE